MVRGLNPVGDLLKRADHTITAAGTAIAAVDGKLAAVDDKLAGVDTVLAEVGGTLEQVRTLLENLTEELAVVQEVPRLREQLDQVLGLLEAQHQK